MESAVSVSVCVWNVELISRAHKTRTGSISSKCVKHVWRLRQHRDVACASHQNSKPHTSVYLHPPDGFPMTRTPIHAARAPHTEIAIDARGSLSDRVRFLLSLSRGFLAPLLLLAGGAHPALALSHRVLCARKTHTHPRWPTVSMVRAEREGVVLCGPVQQRSITFRYVA